MNLHKVKIGDYVKIFNEEKKINEFYRLITWTTADYEKFIRLVHVTDEDLLMFAPPEWFDEK